MDLNHRPSFSSDRKLGPSEENAVFQAMESKLTGHWHLKG